MDNLKWNSNFTIKECISNFSNYPILFLYSNPLLVEFTNNEVINNSIELDIAVLSQE